MIDSVFVSVCVSVSVFVPASVIKKKSSASCVPVCLKKYAVSECVCSCVCACVCVCACERVYWLRWFGVGIVMGVVVDVGVGGSECVFVSPLSYSKLVIREH